MEQERLEAGHDAHMRGLREEHETAARLMSENYDAKLRHLVNNYETRIKSLQVLENGDGSETVDDLERLRFAVCPSTITVHVDAWTWLRMPERCWTYRCVSI